MAKIFWGWSSRKTKKKTLRGKGAQPIFFKFKGKEKDK